MIVKRKMDFNWKCSLMTDCKTSLFYVGVDLVCANIFYTSFYLTVIVALCHKYIRLYNQISNVKCKDCYLKSNIKCKISETSENSKNSTLMFLDYTNWWGIGIFLPNITSELV